MGEVDVEALAMILKGKMSGNLTMPPTCSIFRIPTILSRHTPKAFLPNQFSFGPFHYYNHTLQRTEKIKSKYLLDLVTRASNAAKQTSMNPRDSDAVLIALTKAMANMSAEAREYYAGTIDPMTMAEFVEVLVRDGCFIVELFRRNVYRSELVTRDDPVFSMPCIFEFLWHDLILLENQVPWTVLEKLFEITATPVDKKTLVQLTVQFFCTIFSKIPLRVEPHETKLRESKHILDLLRNTLILNSKGINSKSKGWKDPMRSATMLFETGIKFQRVESASMLDIDFDGKKGILQIPALLIHEPTQTVLRNLVSLEQCCPNYDGEITSYAVLLDNLINTRTDMEILCKNRVIDNWLSIEEATKFFDKLYIDAYVKETFYHELTEKVNVYCRHPWHTYRRVLMRDYFKHPWALISVIAAAVALVLTFVQTVFAIIKP